MNPLRSRGIAAGLVILFAAASCGAGDTGDAAGTVTVFDPRNLAAHAAEAGVVTGSFTDAGAHETARVELPEAPLARPGVQPAPATLLIASNGETVARTELGGAGYLIAGTIDVEEDGIDELVLFGSDVQQGVETGWATIVSLKDGIFRPVERFDGVWQDSCSRSEGNRIRRGETIRLDRSPDGEGFHTEGFSEACDDAAG